MDQKEVEVVLKELEERLDRLRASYDQYFMGFEKLEPTIPRKEVDRRFALLRKENIRNTALRYRFNVATQKYSTYAMYWNRICRQIEEGTFKRHVQRAERRFGRHARREQDLSIDVDMADFESVDIDMEMEDVLAEAERHAASFEVERGDTVPPGAPDDDERPPETPRFGSMPSTYIQTPGTSFAIAGRRSSPEHAAAPPAISPANGVRTARGAPLPAGSKPRILRKVVKGADSAPGSDPPPSHPTNPNARAPMAGDRPSAPRIAPAAAPGARPQIRPRAPMQSAPDIAPSERRIPMPPPSANRIPAAPPSGNRIPVPLPPPSNPRLPVPPPRRPAPSNPDFGENVDPRPSQPPLSGKPRPPLPSQLTRKKDG